MTRTEPNSTLPLLRLPGSRRPGRAAPTTSTWWRRLGVALIAMLLTGFTTWAQQSENETSLPKQAPKPIPAYRQASNIAVITIRGMIDNVTTKSIERRLGEAYRAGAQAVVFEIDTPGGLAFAALEICNAIKNSRIPLRVAWIHPDAYSAGTFISLACQETLMAPYATIGDCAPILPDNKSIGKSERAKYESPLLAEVVDSARRHGYDEKLVMSFIAVDIELWALEHKQTGAIVFVDRQEYLSIYGENPPETVRARVPRSSSTASPGDAPSTLTTAEMRLQEIEPQLALRSQRPELTAADRDSYQLSEPVVDGKTLLVVKTEQALHWGLARKVVANDEELKAYFGATQLTRYNRSWSESLIQILTSIPVRLGLVVIFAIGLLWEMTTPGIGIPGSVAAGALLLLLGAPALTGLAQWWDILFVFAGIGLIVLELFVIPGFGIAGIAGLALLGLGFIGTFVAPDPSGSFLPTTAAARDAMYRGAVVLLLAFFAVGVAMYFASRFLGQVPILGKLVLASGDSRENARPTVLEAMADPGKGQPAVGDIGEAVTPLRPVGRARFAGLLYDVVAGRGSVETGQHVRITAMERFRIVVEADQQEDDGAA